MIRIKLEAEEQEEETPLPIENENNRIKRILSLKIFENNLNSNNVGGSTSDTNDGNVSGTLKSSQRLPEKNVIIPKKKKKPKLDNSTTNFVAVGSKSIKTEPAESSLSLTTQLNNSLNIQSLLRQNRIQNGWTTNEQSIPIGTQQQQQSLLLPKIEPIVSDNQQEVPLSLIPNLNSWETTSQQFRENENDRIKTLLLSSLDFISDSGPISGVDSSPASSTSAAVAAPAPEETLLLNSTTDSVATLGSKSIKTEPSESSLSLTTKVNNSLNLQSLLGQNQIQNVWATNEQSIPNGTRKQQFLLLLNIEPFVPTDNHHHQEVPLDQSLSLISNSISEETTTTANSDIERENNRIKTNLSMKFFGSNNNNNDSGSGSISGVDQSTTSESVSLILDPEITTEKIRQKRENFRKLRQQRWANATPEQRELIREKEREKYRRYLEKESEEKRKQRLEKKRKQSRMARKQRKEQEWQTMTAEEREKERAIYRKNCCRNRKRSIYMEELQIEESQSSMSSSSMSNENNGMEIMVPKLLSVVDSFTPESSTSAAVAALSPQPEAAAVPLITIRKKPGPVPLLTLEERKARSRECCRQWYHRKKTEPVDPEVRAEMQHRKLEYHRRWRQQRLANATPEQRELIRENYRETARRKRERESEEQRQRRLERERQNRRTVYKEREKERAIYRENCKMSLEESQLEVERKALKKEKNRLQYQRQKVKQIIDPEIRAKMRMKHLEYVRRWRRKESEEQRQRRLERRRQYKQRIKQKTLTPEEREKKRAYHREYYYRTKNRKLIMEKEMESQNSMSSSSTTMTNENNNGMEIETTKPGPSMKLPRRTRCQRNVKSKQYLEFDTDPDDFDDSDSD